MILPLPRVRPARLRRRHAALLVSALFLVLLPLALTAWYLEARAAPRYIATAGFSVRAEEGSGALDLLGGMADLATPASADTDILQDFIESPEITRRLATRLDLAALWSRPHGAWTDSGADPLFAYDPTGQAEDLARYWHSRVRVTRRAGTALLSLEVEGFTPEDARQIAEGVIAEARALIDRLSAQARADAMAQAQEELTHARDRLGTARAALTRFRHETRIVDPQSALQIRAGVMSSLQERLAQAVIDLDLLRQSAPDARFRIEAAEHRVAVIEARIASEEARLGTGGGPDAAPAAFADHVGRYERLATDLRFAEESYMLARAALDRARTEADRQSRYLALHVAPARPETAAAPQKARALALVGGFATLLWIMGALADWAIRDRR
ncbi:capsule biosynthesis protein [Roseivivax sp. GX 12232]|uniref:capsule biosynthesis protein n=1 Tax=Roseivivax sp. GX 12232 TaxID=2900547 RepID=UPI001E5B692C|nr:capsule biosynthesis protein [Roseivivax sp. GX 12232]MCE0506219.1 capsule biosynthesis protein [Roseivivax sp. GX 12232]